MKMSRRITTLILSIAVFACAPAPDATDDGGPGGEAALDEIAERYVRLVLGVGEHDDGYVDAYYGPEAWRDEVASEPPDLPTLLTESRDLLAAVDEVTLATDGDELVHLRRDYLAGQLGAVEAYVRILQGEEMTFDQESEALYDAVVPGQDRDRFQAILDRLDELMPGEGPLTERYERWQEDFVIPVDRLDAVFQAAIEEARSRTRRHLELPDGESFVVEYVTDKPWSGYNWYQGGGQSLIQLNTDLPIYIDRAIDLAAHEGYPGHHVYNASLEKSLVDGRGWPEFSVYALFSPQSLIAEGSANFGIQVAFPGDERLRFERDVLYPLAGLDPERGAEYAEVQELVDGLEYADVEAARRYLDGEIDAAEAADWIETYRLYSEDRARQRVRFYDTYRSYVINYNWGKDLVRRYVEALGGTVDRPLRRWEVFADLLASPRLPSALKKEIQ